MEELIDILDAGRHSLVVGNGEVRTFDGRGVADLLNLLDAEPDFLRGASVADKVVGKGAAALMVAGGVVEVYAGVISSLAYDLLKSNGVAVTYGSFVDNIINRQGDGICPVERLCAACHTAAECVPLIRNFVESMKNRK